VRVLVVDDSPEDRATYRRFLGALGEPVPIVEAETAAEALRRLHEGYDCVLLDHHLPDADGLELCSPTSAAVPAARP
jgi:CheY-like chemotaxis protein